MTDEEIPKGRPWMLALGVGLAVGAGVLYAWSRLRPCDCEEGSEPERSLLPVEDMLNPMAAIKRWEERHPTKSAPEPEPEPDPLAWDTHAENAWGLNVGGARRLDDYRVVDEVESDELN